MAKFVERTNHYNLLLALGAQVIEEPTFHYERAKVSGAMWEGRAALQLNGNQFIMQLWHHGADEETLERLLPEYVIKGIKLLRDDLTYQYVDVGWKCIFTTTGIWLHNDGWFGFDPASQKLKDAIRPVEGNHNCRLAVLEPSEEAALLDLGFIKLVEWRDA